MFELSVNNLKKYLDSTQIFEDVSFKIYEGEKVGIVGDNGCGKSTILKIISGLISITRDDKGNIFIPKNAVIGYLEQIPNYPENLKVYEVLNLAFSGIEDIEKNIKLLEANMNSIDGIELEIALKKYSRLQSEYEAKGGYDKEEKLSKVCTGLKIDSNFLNKSFKLLSGGEKTTVLLGKILLENPDILLLDEPTNHLDMESCEWLEGYLNSYKGIVIIVSHDRYFLDNIVNKIIEIEDMYCETYKGNYSSFIKQKEENMLIQFNAYKEQQKKIAAIEKAIKDLRDWATRSDNNKFFKRAASMQKNLDKMQRIDKPKIERTNINLRFNETERSGNDVIKVKDLNKNYDKKVLFNNAEVMINYKERVALIGPNGCGKTTFIKMLLGEEKIDSGEIVIGESVKLAYLPQNIEFIDEEATLIEEFRRGISIIEGKAREYLSKFMFFGNTVFKKLKHLSGGERIRLKLSKLLYNDINLLILDEPTNHLDINSIDTLEEALNYFDGTILFISHDRYFINKISDRIILLENHKFKSYSGNYDYYKKEKEKERTLEEEVIKKSTDKQLNSWQEKKQADKKIRKEKAKIDKIERDVFILEEKIKTIEEKMIELGADYNKVNELLKEKEILEKEHEKLMIEWEKCLNNSEIL